MTVQIPDVLVAPDAVRDPYTFFERLRLDDPVHWSERHRAWILTRYDDVRHGLNDERLSTSNVEDLQRGMTPSELERFAPAADLLRSWMIFNDPPQHTALRAPVRTAFTPRAVEALRPDIVALVGELIEKTGGADEFDLLRTIGFTLPSTVIAILLGVPTERAAEFKEWSRWLGPLVMGKIEREDVWERALASAKNFEELFGQLISFYEQAPADNLLSRLIAARDAGEHLSDHQMVGAATMILFGGHETTTNLIANGTLALLQHPDDLERLRAEPELITPAVEEMLRFDGPSKCFVRRARMDLEWFDGTPFERGQLVYCATAAANHDPAMFPDPSRFYIAREPNQHLSFGWGMHFCLGAQLARLEAQIVIAALISRFPKLRLAVEPQELAWHPTIVGRALKSLPVAVG